MVVYLTYWFPRAYRARVIAAFLLSVPLTGVFGAPLATSLMQIEAWDMRSWQWLFLLEGIPSVLIGIAALWYLTDRPGKAHWLRPKSATGWSKPSPASATSWKRCTARSRPGGQ